MAFRAGGGGGRKAIGAAPANYIPGLGRGAAGFTTRSDVGPATSSSASSNMVVATGDGSSSRAAEARAAIKQHHQQQKQQQQQQQLHSAPSTAFGAAPANYVAGAGRGATRLSRDGDDTSGGGTGVYDAFGGYMDMGSADASGQYDEDDDEADKIWAAIDDRMNSKRRKKVGDDDDNDAQNKASRVLQIGAQFRELKEKLADVTEDQWAAIPDVGDYSLKFKQKRRQQDTYTPVTDQLIDQQKQINQDATSGTAALGANTVIDGGMTTVANISGLSAARGTVLGMSLDKQVSGQQTSLDATGYLTSLSSTKVATSAEVGDITKARLLLKSVRDTNPKHGPGWIASARVEEAAGKTLQARKIIQEGCHICPDNEDVWLEAARLHPLEVGKSILATAVRRIPTSVKIFLKAADMEHSEAAKKAVLRKALEANPTSVTLWKAAVELEEVDDARVLLAVAVEKIPHSVEMWLALARLETYQNAQKVLNKARQALPTDRSIWIAAAKLEESQNHVDIVDKVIERAVKSLMKNEAVISRDQWLKEAEAAEASSAPYTSASIVKYTIGKDVDEEDRQRTWSEDAKGAVQRGSIATARAILAHALEAYPTKRKLWLQSVELERLHGTPGSLDVVLTDATQRLPRAEIFWLLRAKELWLSENVNKAREILTEAFAANPNSQDLWLAAAKLEWENGEIERARVLLQRARERAPTDRVYMKSAVLEREEKKFGEALQLIEEGIGLYPKFPKLYMIGGQICSDDLPKQKSSLLRARQFYQRGLQQCPENTGIWILSSRLEEMSNAFDPDLTAKYGAGSTKARSLLELARLQNPKNPELFLEAIRLERRNGNDKLAETLMAKALQECPTSGALLAENIMTSPRVEQKSKSADAIQRCPDDPRVIYAVASLFATERKWDKARKWFDRAVVLDRDLGDAWARAYAFEIEHGTTDQQEKVMERCIQAEPKHGEIWTSIMKDISNRKRSVSEVLALTATVIISEKSSKAKAH
jgi:pre-mRNA-processing factor 6